MRALTPATCARRNALDTSSRNEVLAREGIDTVAPNNTSYSVLCSRNEVLAREGIDTKWNSTIPGISATCRNEVLAREGIDTISFAAQDKYLEVVEMRY